ncbi:MAG: NAD(P)H-dependent oxidoreductase [Candidatus Pacebacteria bacterium]|nr:NAD(P)H-dependent oxidoreductase [Candidatus Paceibacterota bacterium]
MHIVGISGSPRKQNTHYMLKTLLEATDQPFEIINLSELKIGSCNDCRSCHKDYKCILSDDMQTIYMKLEKADIIVLGSPTYFDNVSGIMKNFFDRTLPFYFSGKLINKKVILLTSANFGEYIEFDEKGQCKWHEDEKRSAKKCLQVMENYCDLIGLKVFEKIYALHDNGKSEKKKLIKIGKQL